MGPIVSMEMALAEASFEGSRIIEWVKSLNSFEKSTLWHSFIMENGFKKINLSILIDILFNIFLWDLPGRVFYPELERETGLGRESSWETKLELLTRIELARMDRASD